MINKFEAIGVGVSVAAMALALFLMRVDTTTDSQAVVSDADNRAEAVVVADGNDQQAALLSAFTDASNGRGGITKLVVDDVVLGIGNEVETGDTVTVHYVGTLQNGQEFDNSRKRGAPFTFTVGEGKVIAGWEEGVVGMKVGGQRILVIPSDMAYGDAGFGPIPGGATLVFAIELIAIK